MQCPVLAINTLTAPWQKSQIILFIIYILKYCFYINVGYLLELTFLFEKILFAREKKNLMSLVGFGYNVLHNA